MKRQITMLVTGLILTAPVFAQSDDAWDFKVAPYLWLVGIEGTLSVGTSTGDLDASFSDILDQLDFAGQVFFSGQRGKHGFHVDYTYLRLKPDDTPLSTPPFPPESTLGTKLTTNLLEVAYNHYFDVPDNDVAFLVGLRYTDMEIQLDPSFQEGRINAGPSSLTDFFVGVRTVTPISDKWAFSFQGTAGTGDSESPLTLQAVFSREVRHGNRLAIGARYWKLKFREDGPKNMPVTMDTNFAGLMVGYMFD